jgi:hypothetical protein
VGRPDVGAASQGAFAARLDIETLADLAPSSSAQPVTEDHPRVSLDSHQANRGLLTNSH